MRRQKIKSPFEFSQVPISLRSAELADTVEIQRDNVVLSGTAEPISHRLLLRSIQLAQGCSAHLVQRA